QGCGPTESPDCALIEGSGPTADCGWAVNAPRACRRRVPVPKSSIGPQSGLLCWSETLSPHNRFPLPASCLRIEFRAELWLCWRPLSEQPRDDSIPVIAAVLDEHLVGVVAGNYHPGDEHARHRGLKCFRVVRRNPCLRIDRNATVPQQIHVGRKSGHDVDAIGFQAILAEARGDDHFVRRNRRDAAVPPHLDLSFLYAI